MKRILFVTCCVLFFCKVNLAQEGKNSLKNELAPYSIGKVHPLLGSPILPEMQAKSIDNTHQNDSLIAPKVQPRMASFAIENPQK